MHSKKRMTLLATIGAALIIVAVSPSLSASSGGVGSGTVEYNCRGSCHNALGSATVTMWASNVTPFIDADVTVMVNVTGGQATADGIIGVMLVSKLVADATSLPSHDGWTILQDPSETASANNYYENYTYTGSRTFEWKLRTPALPNENYTLYARIMHGGGGKYYEDYTTGLHFDVDIPAVTGKPLVLITSVTSSQVLEGTVTVNVTANGSAAIQSVVLRLNNTVIGNDTSQPFSFTLDTTKFSDGYYLLNATATDANGARGYRQIPVSIDNAPAPGTKELISWVWTLAAGSIAILAWIGILIVVALIIRRRSVARREK